MSAGHSARAGDGYASHKLATLELFERGSRSMDAEAGVGALSVAAVAEKVGLSKSRAQDVLVELEREGVLRRGKRGRAFEYWMPADLVIEASS